MEYKFAALLSVCIFALIHLLGNKTSKLNLKTQSILLSTGGGVAISYVFIDLLPKLCKSDLIVHHSGFLPYFEKHVYILALFAFLLFYSVDRTKNQVQCYWLGLASYTLFNFLIGYAIVDKNNPEVKPLALFTFAIGLHYFVNDFTLSENATYQKSGRWIVICALFLGWLCGFFTNLPPVSIALVSAFIGGGVIMNVIRHELPKENPNNDKAFLLSAFLYMITLLFIG